MQDLTRDVRSASAADFSVNMTFPYDVPTSVGSCGDYLPVDSVFNRFIWNIGFLVRNGFYVLVDNRTSPGPMIPACPSAIRQ